MKEANETIGIISWFPDENNDRSKRILRFERLLNQLKTLFLGTPIIVVAQNWKDYEPFDNNLYIYKYNKLGILPARNELRRIFLKSNYSHLIMFDDDAIIEQTKTGLAQEYIEQIRQHPRGFAFVKKESYVEGRDNPNPYRDSQLNLCAISRYIYEKEPIPTVYAQEGEAFEDRLFSTLLHYKYRNLEFNVPEGLVCSHFKNPNIDNFGGEVPSTWANEKQMNWKNMRKRTLITERYIYDNKELPINLHGFWRKNGL